MGVWSRPHGWKMEAGNATRNLMSSTDIDSNAHGRKKVHEPDAIGGGRCTDRIPINDWEKLKTSVWDGGAQYSINSVERNRIS